MRSLNGLLVGVAAVATAGGAATAQQYSSDFTTGLGAASAYGDATLNGGSVRLTRDRDGVIGALVLNTWAEGASAFEASFDYSFSTGADPVQDAGEGISFSLGVLPDGVTPGTAERGPGNGLTVSLIINTGGSSFAAAYVFHNGTPIFTNPNAFVRGANAGVFRTVTISFTYDGHLTVRYGGVEVVTLQVAGFVPQAGQRFGFSARTGDTSAEQRIDHVTVTPYYNRPSCGGSAAIRGDGVWGYSYDAVNSSIEGDASCVSGLSCRDVWFCWQATTDGTATVTTVGLTDDDSVLSAYAGCQPCPGSFGELACNDNDATSMSLQSRMSFPVRSGGTYSLRVALFGAANFSASGLEAFRITTAPSCAADFNRSGVLGVQDIFDFLAAYFTGCP